MVQYFVHAILFALFMDGVNGQYGNCSGHLEGISNGRCDMGNNNADCGYDGGDCCECSCMNNRLYPCGIWGFECSDPDIIGNEGGCYNETASVRHCSSDAPVNWVVYDTTSAMSLAEAVNCSGGTFEVVWRGNVLIDYTIDIPNGTTLYVSGEGSGAEVDGGGRTRLFMAVGAELHIEGLILSNGSATYGGAIAATRSSVFLNQTLFKGNIASSLGGAIYVGMGSTLAGEGQTMLTDNRAGHNGGGIAVSMYSSAFWSGVTEFSFNSAVGNDSFGGAAFVSDHSRTLWHGVTFFVNNFAGGGGALGVFVDSTAVWNGETYFANNTADDAGGAVLVWGNSNVSWDGVTVFVNNSANNGGALAVSDNANALWTGKTSFAVNNAIYNGGAIYSNISSGFIVGGYTHFINNTAGIDGGAAFLYSGFDDSISPHFILNDTAAVLLERNTCGQNGGAVAVYGEVVTRFLLYLVFYENTAGLFGGAIYMSGVSVGIVFQSTWFESNSAKIGGAIYSTDSEASLIGCTFLANDAERMGGAMDSGEGRDTIVNTSFVGNSALIGGALSLIGIASLIGCEFVENSANGNEGPAISNDGVISSMSRCSFIDNTFNCEPGYYLEHNDTNALFNNVCKGCDTTCLGCTVGGEQPTKCVETLEHSSALGVRNTLESLSIDPGYWRATTTSDYILACYNSKACLGGVTGEIGYCLKGYEGPYCSVCSTGYTRGLGYVCNMCVGNTARTITIAVAVGIAFLLASFAFLSYMLSGKMNDTDHSIVARIISFIPLQSVKIVIVVWQILTQFSTVANAVFPSIYQRFLDGVNILNFDLSWVLSIGCMIDTDFHDKLLLATMGPLVCIAILGGTYVAAMGRSNHSEEACGIVRRKHLSMLLLLTFLVYSSVSLTIFKTFACDELDDGKNYLRADYRIDCDSSKHDTLEIYAGFMIVLYVVGIPTFYGVLLYSNRDALLSSTGREEDERIKPITDLWKPYRPGRFYYEVIECVRRMLLTGALVFIYPNTAGQIAVALMIATFFIFVSEALAPYESPWDTWCNRTGHAIVFTSMFLALLLKVEVSKETAKSQVVFESVLVAVHSCLILVVFIEAFTMFMAWWKEVKEDNKPRIRPSLTI